MKFLHPTEIWGKNKDFLETYRGGREEKYFLTTDLSIIVDDDPSIDIEDDHSDDGDDSKAVSHIPIQDETIEVPPLLRGLRGLLLELISL